MPHECCARRLLQTRNVGIMCLCCQNLKHGRVGFRLKQRSVKSTTTKITTKQIKLLLSIMWWWRLLWESCFRSKAIIASVRLLKNPNTGTFICEVHLKLADKDKRFCDNEAYTPPKKVRHWHLLILPSRGMLLCTTKPFVGVSDNIPTHRHTPKQSFICLTSAQGHNQPTPRVQTLTGMNP